jgi:hypothetical protein
VALLAETNANGAKDALLRLRDRRSAARRGEATHTYPDQERLILDLELLKVA